MKRSVHAVVLLVLFLGTGLPAALAGALPAERAALAGAARHIENLGGSVVSFEPSVGGAPCFAGGTAQTFCFEAHSFSPDGEDVTDLWVSFYGDWTVTNAYVLGSPAPSCSPGGSWGNFSWSYQTSPWEIHINHPRFQVPGGDCVAFYCFDVTSGTGDPWAWERWYWKGDDSGAPPHHPCSNDLYTPAGQHTCDEWIKPRAAIPSCDPRALWMLPEVIDAQGCAYQAQEHELTLFNNRGSAKTVNLTYTMSPVDGSCSGPASVVVQGGLFAHFDVSLTPYGQVGDEVTCQIDTVDALDPDIHDTSWINKEIVCPQEYSAHVFKMKMVWKYGARPGRYKVMTQVSVHDQAHVLLPGATVSGDYTLPNGTIVSLNKVTAPDGVAKFPLNTAQVGVHQFCVTNIAKAGYVYDPASNHLNPPCKSLQVGP